MTINQHKTILITLCVVLLSTSIVFAQSTYTGLSKPRQEMTEAELSAYRDWDQVQARRDYTRAIEYAKKYIDRYPDGVYTRFLGKWIEAHQALLDVEPEMSRLRCQHIRSYLDYDSMDPEYWSHKIVIKMDEEAFSEVSVRQAVEVLSRKYPEPHDLRINIITVYQQMPNGIPPWRPSKVYFEHHRAFYSRFNGKESLEYTENPTDVGLKRIELK